MSKEIADGLYLINPESVIQPSAQVDIGVHLFFHEFSRGSRLEPYTSKIEERIRSSGHPIIASVPYCDWAGFTDRFLAIQGKRSLPLILYKTDISGHSPIDHGRLFGTLADFIQRQFKPNLLVVYGCYLWDEDDEILGPQGCVGHTYQGLKKELPNVPVEIDRNLVA